MKKLSLVFIVFLFLVLVACEGEQTFDENATIQVYTRDTTSGTRGAFFDGINWSAAASNNGLLVETFVEVAGNGPLISAVTNDIYGIGYISLASLDDSGLRALTFEGIEATAENVINGSYQIVTTYNYMIRNDYTGIETEGEIVLALLAFTETLDAKATMLNNDGIVDLQASDPEWDDIRENYPVCQLDNSNVTVKFGGSTSVEPIGRALSQEFSSKCGNFIAEHGHTGSGDAFRRTQGDQSTGANAIHIGFSSRPFNESELIHDGTYGELARNAVVIVVNPANTFISNITEAQIQDVLKGVLRRWSDLT